jgi:hypothetical protein
LGGDWHAVNDTMLAYGQLLVDDPERIGPVQPIGMDQTLFNRGGEYRTQAWATMFADMAGHRLLDITEGRDTESVITWLQQRPRSWLQAVEDVGGQRARGSPYSAGSRVRDTELMQ